MPFLLSRRVLARRGVLILASSPVFAPVFTGAANVRIVTYNTQADVGISNTTLIPNIVTVIEGIGQQKYAGDSILQLPDIVALQETTSNSTTVSPLVGDLNSFYSNTGLYAYSAYQATQSGGTTDGNGPNALIYNQTTLNLIASVGVGTPTGLSNGEYRQVVRYEFQPLAYKGTNFGDFYVYDSHYKSGAASETEGSGSTLTTVGALRNLEAQIIRNDEATNLPANAAVVYVGDYNGDGSTETAYQTITAANSPGGGNQGQGIDPENTTDDYTQTWSGKSKYKTLLSEADDSLYYRDDLQVMTSNVFNDAANTLDYVAGSYHVFGNNGTTAISGITNSSTNTALNDIIGNGTLTTTTVLAAMNNSIGSDHLPVVADYTIVVGSGIWNGGTGNWSNSTLWSNNVVPNISSIEVKVDNGNPTASVVTLDQNATVQDVTVDVADRLNISSAFTLVLGGPSGSSFNGQLINAGVINAIAITNGGTFSSTGTLSVTSSFNNSGTVTIGGKQNWSAGSLFLNTVGTATFTTDAGSASTSTLNVNVSGGSVLFSATQHLTNLTLAGTGVAGITQQSNHSNRSLVVVGGLNFGGSTNSWTGKFDLTTNDLDVKNGSLTNITNQIRQGFNGGSWNGSGGIVSSAAGNSASPLTALGVIQNSFSGLPSGSPLYGSGTTLGLFDGANPAVTDVLVKYTYYGDANLDGKVDGTDYSRIDQGFISHTTGWYNGDFNYDGVVDGSDYTLIDNAFNTQGASLSAISSMDIAVSTVQVAGSSSVPEPGVSGLLVVAAGLLGRQRCKGR